MKKNVLSLLLVWAMSIGLLAGCSNGGNQSSKANGSSEGAVAGTETGSSEVDGIDTSETYEATIVLMGSEQPDEQKVVDKINEILMRDINTKINIVMLSYGDYSTQLPLMLQGGDKVDLIPIINSAAGSFINNKMVVNLKDYVENYGDNIKSAFSEMGEELVDTASINDFMFGIPVVKGSSGVSTICLRADWLEEAGFTRDDIKSVDDMDAVYEKVQENHPSSVMMWITKGMSADSRYETCDPLTDFNGVLLNFWESPVVVNWFASDDYKVLVTRHFNWAQKGWISKDAATTTDQASTAVQAGRAFSFYTPGGPEAEATNSASCGTEMYNIPVTEGQLTTTGYGYNSWGIAQSSENPERAFLLLNYLYGSSEVTDLLNYGIEDEHYVVSDDGLYTYPDGVDVTTSTYTFNQGWELPNASLGGIWEGNDPDLWEKQIEVTKSAQKSCALGFAYDSSALSSEIAAIENVKSQYVDAFNAGVADPDVELPKFIKALEDAGIQKVIDEKQKQLDAWLADKQN